MAARTKLLKMAGLGAGALVAIASCGGQTAQVPTPTPPTAQTQQREADLHAQLMRRSDGEQPGRVAQVSGNTLVLDPYQAAAGEARLFFDPNDTPIYVNGRRAGSGEALRPGQDVRVYFRRQPNGQPLVTAVTLLDPETARQLAGRLGGTAAGGQPIPPPVAGNVPSVPGSVPPPAGMGRQPGRILSLSDDILLLDPYEPRAGNARLRLGANAAILQPGGGAADRQALRPGTDVMVYFQQAGGGPLQVVRVDILDPQTAREIARREGASPGGERPPAQATGRQPGRIVSVTENMLILDPYEERAGIARLRFEDQARVQQPGGGEADRQALRPGTNVMVFFRSMPGQAPEVVRVDILAPEQARELERQYSRAPGRQPM